MSRDYVVTIALGPHAAPAWSMTSDSRVPVDRAAGVWVLDGYRQGWTMPDEWPAQPDPSSAGFTVAAVTPDALPPMDIGTPVLVTVAYVTSLGDASEQIDFAGRITDAVARPVTLPTDAGPLPGLAVEFTCVDYLADLAETYVAAAPWPAEYPSARVQRIFDSAGLTLLSTPNLSVYDQFAAMDVDHRTVADVLEEHLRQVASIGNLATTSVTGWQRPVVVPIVSSGAEGWPPAGEVVWDLVGLQERTTYEGGPLVLANLGGQITPVAQPTAGTLYGANAVKAVSAGYVDTDVEWRRDKAKATNRVVISGAFAGLFNELGNDLSVTIPTVEASFPDLVEQRGPITQAHDSTFSYIHSAKKMAAMYLGDENDIAGQWGVQAFTVHLSDVPEANIFGLLRSTFMPAHGQGYSIFVANYYPYGLAVCVYDLQPAHQLTNYPWITGALQGASLAIVDGEMTLTCEVRPGTPRQGYSDQSDYPPYSAYEAYPLCPQTFRERFPTATFKDKGDGTPYLDPKMTFYDARLIRSAPNV